MSIQSGFPEKLAKALTNADAPVQQAFLQMIEALKPHCSCHKGRDKPDYCFYLRPQFNGQFCGIVPQVSQIRVGVKNRDARVSSRILELKRVPSNPAWEECLVEPTNSAHVHEAIRIIVEVSRALDGPGGPYIPAEAQAPKVQQKAVLRASPRTVAAGPKKPVVKGPEASPNDDFLAKLR